MWQPNIAARCGLKKTFNTEWQFETKSSGLIIKGGLKIKGSKIDGPL